MGSFVSIDDPYKDGILIDVRSHQEWNESHITGASHIPLDNLENKITLLVPNKNTPINIYCLSGTRSSTAKDKLTSMGYEKVANIGGLKMAQEKLLNNNK